MKFHDSWQFKLMILSTFIKFWNFVISLMPIQKFSSEFRSLLNFRNFGLIIWKQWKKIFLNSISQLPSLVDKTDNYWRTSFIRLASTEGNLCQPLAEPEVAKKNDFFFSSLSDDRPLNAFSVCLSRWNAR